MSDFNSRMDQFREALVEALTDEQAPASEDSAPELAEDPASAPPSDSLLRTLSSLVRDARLGASEDETVVAAIDALAAVAAGPTLERAVSEAASRFESPQRLRETLFFARCLRRDVDGSLRLIAAIDYLSGAIMPPGYRDLYEAQTSLLHEVSFSSLWQNAGSLQRWLDSINEWQAGYRKVYVENHSAFDAVMADIARQATAIHWQATAIERLNQVENLGRPIALQQLNRFHEMETRLPCPASDQELNGLLATSPVCSYCGYRLGEEPPGEDANTIFVALEFAVFTHRQRLQQLVLPRLQALPARGLTLDRLIKALQAGDSQQLARCLDPGLVAFLEDLLSTPQPRIDLLGQLALQFPELRLDNLDRATAAFREIAEAEIGRGNGSIRIDAPPGDTGS